MKRLVLAAIFGLVSLTSIDTKAQVNVSINLGSQPEWGPAGYNHVDYYYLPEAESYYYVPTKQYVYQNNGAWVWKNSLPAKYSNINLYNTRKVVINKKAPYLNHQSNVKLYSNKNYSRQIALRDNRDTKYVNVRNSKPGRGNAISKGNDKKNDNKGRSNGKKH